MYAGRSNTIQPHPSLFPGWPRARQRACLQWSLYAFRTTCAIVCPPPSRTPDPSAASFSTTPKTQTGFKITVEKFADRCVPDAEYERYVLHSAATCWFYLYHVHLLCICLPRNCPLLIQDRPLLFSHHKKRKKKGRECNTFPSYPPPSTLVLHTLLTALGLLQS